MAQGLFFSMHPMEGSLALETINPPGNAIPSHVQVKSYLCHHLGFDSQPHHNFTVRCPEGYSCVENCQDIEGVNNAPRLGVRTSLVNVIEVKSESIHFNGIIINLSNYKIIDTKVHLLVSKDWRNCQWKQ